MMFYNICPTGDEWKPVTEIPREYIIAPKIENPDIEQDTITTRTAATVTAKPPEQAKPAVIAAAPFVLVADNPRDKLKEITAKLEAGIKGIFDSEQYKSYLKTLSKFHNYSFNNCLLIAMQKPDASHVAGFNAWRDDFKRPVKKGEKGIKILAPAPFKTKREVDRTDANGKPVFENGKRAKDTVEVTVPAFKVTTVFDVSQTDGEPLPQIGVDELTGSVDKYKELFAALEKTSPVPVAFEAITGGAKGYYQQMEKRIAINEGMSELQNLKTLIHEIAHSRLHDIDKNAPATEPHPDRRTREVEAESIAYTVCQHYGLDTSDYSFGYVATWSGDKQLDTLKASLDIIRKEADAIITEVDKHFAELTQDKEQTADKPVPERQPGYEKWSEPATPENAPDNPGVPSDDVSAYLPQQGDTFTIYQLRDGDQTRDLRFESLAAITAAGLTAELVNYDKTYTAPLDTSTTLEKIYFTFNMDRPEDFTGHSLSVSDVVVMNRDGKETAFYVDSAGFKELPDFLPKEPARENQVETRSAVNSNYKDMVALVGADDKVYLGKSENYHFVTPAAMPWHEPGDKFELGNGASFYDNSDNSLVFVSDNPKMYGFMYGDGWVKSQVDMLKDNIFTQADYTEFARIQSEVVNGLPYKDDFTGIKFDGKPFDPSPAPAVNLAAVADYLQKQYNIVHAADPKTEQGQAAFNTVIKRLDSVVERMPDDQKRLTVLFSHAAQSPDLETLKNRMVSVNANFIQHYSTAVQNTVDTGGKAEPPTAAASVRQTEPAPAPKPPAQGENVAAIEAKVKAGETINLSDLSDAIKKDKAAAQTAPTTAKPTTRTYTQGKNTAAKPTAPEKPSIRDEIAAGKKQLAAQKSAPAKTAAKDKNAAIGG